MVINRRVVLCNLFSILILHFAVWPGWFLVATPSFNESFKKALPTQYRSLYDKVNSNFGFCIYAIFIETDEIL